jgi:hypothetical protein
MRVTFDNGALASVNVSGEYPNSDALKAGDGQVTVGLSDTVDQKLDLTGKVRRRTSTVRVNVWSSDISSIKESGKTLRGKIAEEVNRIIRQNRSRPNLTSYTFAGSGPDGAVCRAFSGNTEAAPDADWTEVSGIGYQNLWYSDDSRLQISNSQSGGYAVLLLGFRLESRRSAVKQLVFCFEGYGSAAGGGGVTVKVWNRTSMVWQNPQSSQADGADEALTLELTVDLADFIDEGGWVWFLAETRNASDGSVPAVLFCDYASCTTTVNGISGCDIAGCRSLERFDLKPPVYRAEFTVKSWFIENIGV